MPGVTEASRGGYKLLPIPTGTFLMGSPESEAGRSECESPAHRVAVPAFHLGPYPVTNREYRSFLDANPHQEEPDFWTNQAFRHALQPVVGVTFEDAKRYCAWAGLRLPTEAEWEYACRAGTTTRYYTGDAESDLRRAAWYSRAAQRRLHWIGQKAPNALGLFDMHGNIWEWCEDDWHDNYGGAPDDASAWVDHPRSEMRVLRGGSWFGNLPDYLRSATRHLGPYNLSDFNVGFRCAL